MPTLETSLSISSFRRHLKTFLFSFYYIRSAFGVLLFQHTLYKIHCYYS